MDQELINMLKAENDKLKENVPAGEAELVTVVKEVVVSDNEMINKLTAENQKLKALVSSLEKEADEAKHQAREAESQNIHLKTTMQSLQERVSDLEDEKILKRQASLASASRKIPERLTSTKSQLSENGYNGLRSAPPSKKYGTESDKDMRRSMLEKQRENADYLIKCATQDLGFCEGKPVAAFTIYKCLIHWKSFEAERTSVFDRLIQMIGAAIENQSDTKLMAYWLSNTSTLLFLLQCSLKPSGAASTRPPPSPSPSFFERMTHRLRSGNYSFSRTDFVRNVEAKYPAMLFKQQLTAYVEKIATIIRDNLKKELSELMSSYIKASGSSPPANHWQRIIASLNKFLSTLKENHVAPVLVNKIFTQILSYINMQLFNSLLLHRECCTFKNGEFVKAGLDELEFWCGHANYEMHYAGESWDELRHVRQAVGFLVMHKKSRITYDDLTYDLCPVLSVQQLYRLCTLYYDDNYNTPGIDAEVISSIKEKVPEDYSDDDINSFVLGDNSSMPFSVEDIHGSIKEQDLQDVKPPAQLLDNAIFQFLQE